MLLRLTRNWLARCGDADGVSPRQSGKPTRSSTTPATAAVLNAHSRLRRLTTTNAATDPVMI